MNIAGNRSIPAIRLTACNARKSLLAKSRAIFAMAM